MWLGTSAITDLFINQTIVVQSKIIQATVIRE